MNSRQVGRQSSSRQRANHRSKQVRTQVGDKEGHKLGDKEAVAAVDQKANQPPSHSEVRTPAFTVSDKELLYTRSGRIRPLWSLQATTNLATSSVFATSSNGLQPTSDGLHPGSDGLQPTNFLLLVAMHLLLRLFLLIHLFG